MNWRRSFPHSINSCGQQILYVHLYELIIFWKCWKPEHDSVCAASFELISRLPAPLLPLMHRALCAGDQNTMHTYANKFQSQENISKSAAKLATKHGMEYPQRIKKRNKESSENSPSCFASERKSSSHIFKPTNNTLHVAKVTEP